MPKLLKPETKNQIYELRRTGHSIPEIHKMLGISKSTALRHATTVAILPEYKQRWLDRRNSSKIISERAQLTAAAKAEKLVETIGMRDLVLIGASLYWAEGAKKDFSFTNTDGEMVKVFVTILRKVFNIPDKDIKISIRMYEDLDKQECINFWSKITNLNLENNVHINVLKGKKVGKLKYGMCRVRVRKGGLLHKTIFAINKRVTSLVISS